MRRGLPSALIAALVCLALPSIAAAEPCPPYEGVMTFPTITGPEDPENYCWEVQLFEGQELRQISATQAAVFYESGHEAFGIEADPAHDSVGAPVPTTLAVTDPNLITLAVHHRAGNPAAGSASFDYPVSYGPGWEGGFISEEIQGPPDEAELREAALKAQPSPPAEGVPTPTCEVPVLQGRTLKAARRALLLANCQLGPIRGHRRPGTRVVKQYRPAFKVLPAGTEVGVRLAR